MSDLQENTATTLLRILVEQSTANSTSTTQMPSSDPPSSTLTVSTLWFLSIMSSLAATTWAILCLEWCASLTCNVQAGDYEEMAKERQRNFEAMTHWRMDFIVAAIPFFLHLSLFLFLAGLWLRLRNVNNQLGLIVGVPGLVIALSYVVVTLLPIFTNAPFSTSVSQLIKPVVDRIRRVVNSISIRPPRLFQWIAKCFPVVDLHRIPSPFPLKTSCLTAFPRRVYSIGRRWIPTIWKIVILLPIIPTVGLARNPFDELKNLKVGLSDQDKGIQLRALYWLMNTPLGQEEVKEILREFRDQEILRESRGQEILRESRGQDVPREPLDRTIVRLLVLSLSSVLEDNRISKNEQPIFNHCTAALAGEMDRAFGDGKHSQRILFQSTTIPEKLLPHFHLTASDEDANTQIGPQATEISQEYWERTFSALWLCPSTKAIRIVVDRLDSNIQTMKATEVPFLKEIVRGLHAATLTCSNPEEFNHELVPDFSLRNWYHGPHDRDLYKALSGYLQYLFAAFYNTLKKRGSPATTTSLVVDCLEALDKQSNPNTLRLHNALCFFVVVTQRNDPEVLEEGPSVVPTLLKSAETWNRYTREDGTGGAKVLATRLSAIAYGPRPPILGQHYPLERIRDLYITLPDSIKTDFQCLEGFLDADAATMEAVLAVGGRLASFALQRGLGRRVVRIPSLWLLPVLELVREHQSYRLPYLYSVAIRLSYTTGERNRALWEVADLLVTRDERRGITIEKALDTNTLAVYVLGLALQSGTVEQAEKQEFLASLGDITPYDTGWRTLWKSIYLIGDLVALLSEPNIRSDGEEQRRTLIAAAGERFEEVENLGIVPSDWERKMDRLAICQLEERVRQLVARSGTGEALYKGHGSGNIPYLSLYNPPHPSYFVAVAEMFQQ